jgi:hypothetical protein
MGNSHLVMTGGQIQSLTIVCDQATLTMAGGSIEPLIRSDQAAIPTLILGLTDSAAVHLRGGQLGIPRINLDGSSVVHFYGFDFRVNGSLPTETIFLPGPQIAGRFSDGASFNIDTIGVSPLARVVLHTIPEPSGAVLLGGGAASLLRRRIVQL